MDWTPIREWGSFALAAATVTLVAYDLWWVRHPRLRVRVRRYHNSDRLDISVINKGGGPLVVLGVYFEDSPEPGAGIKVEWAPGDGVLPTTVQSLSVVEWHPELRNPTTLILEGVPFRERFFKIPEPGWEGRVRRFRRANVFGGETKEMKGSRRPPTPRKPLEIR